MTRQPSVPAAGALIGAARARRFRKLLLDWYRKSKRDLPWRRTTDPYAIWVSEVMLQQTQVATVIPYYLRFLARFPTIRDLAGADLDDVLALWTGLGYYSRARNLHRSARAVLERHAGDVPGDYESLSALPGVGPYTAAAVASIAFGLPHPVLDGNVARVLARLEAIAGDDRSPAARRHAHSLLEELLCRESPSEFNQAMMELGALVCTPRGPSCSSCPVAELCLARREGQPERFPERAAGRKAMRVHWTVALVELGDRLLLVRSVTPGLFTGMWELPWIERGPLEMADGLREKYGLQVRPGGVIAELQHGITFRRVVLHAMRAELETGEVRETGDARRWVTRGEMGGYGLSSMASKVLRADSATRDGGAR